MLSLWYIIVAHLDHEIDYIVKLIDYLRKNAIL